MVPSTNVVLLATAAPPVAAAYHCMLVPVTVRFARVLVAANTCGEMAVGAGVAVGWVIVNVLVAEQEFASVTVTVYVPALKPVAVDAVPPDGDQE